MSFEADRSRILGFLGPNGAGKTTTMRIITGSLMADSGEVYVSGIDLAQDDLEIKKRIGYLAEHNPLYADMYVREFLDFIASVHRLENKNKRINELIDMIGLGREQ
ncbi:ATP-binding cassette domain-containing protein, partial [Arthrospira platensis SPKY1]|nr:ATP-binding cassette domain-containing protein [Arthrospira platensis SPKY1]